MKRSARLLSVCLAAIMMVGTLPSTAIAAMRDRMLTPEEPAGLELNAVTDGPVELGDTMTYQLCKTWEDGEEAAEVNLLLALDGLTLPEDVSDLVSCAGEGAALGKLTVEDGALLIPVELTRTLPEVPTDSPETTEIPESTESPNPTESPAPAETTEPTEESRAASTGGGSGPYRAAADSDLIYKLTVNTAGLTVIPTAKRASVTLSADGGSPVTIAVTLPKVGPAPDLEIKTYASPMSKQITWVDNHNEDSIRPDGEAYVEQDFLWFSLDDGETFTKLTRENMAQLGLTELPVPTVIDNGNGVYTLTYGEKTLPAETVRKDQEGQLPGTVQPIRWEMRQPEVPGYATYPDGANEDNWYYVLKTDVEFTFVLNTGTNYRNSDAKALAERILSEFELWVKYIPSGKNESVEQSYDISKLDTNCFTFNEDGNVVLHIPDAWKYNINAAKMEYYVRQKSEEGQTGPSGEIHGLPKSDGVDQKNDYLTVEYDNTHVPNYSQYTDCTYNGGEVKLILVGETDYTATKVWIDPPEHERPEGVFELWRYREGADFSTADVVKHTEDAKDESYKEGEHYTIPLGTEKDEIEMILSELPKYDAEGYRYIYCLREYMDDPNGYTQVYGKVKGDINSNYSVEDTVPYGESRKDGDRYIYDTGTITNHYNESASADAVKIWNAFAYQAYLKDVKVELTLQSRIIVYKDNDSEKPKPTPSDWIDVKKADGKTPVTEIKNGFSEDELGGWHVSGGGPLYDAAGNKLEYRWVETGVFQGSSGENLLKDGTFTLKHGDKTVTYQSVVSEDGTTITNAIADTIDYAVEKVWGDGTTERPLTFHLYRVPAGETLSENADSYLDFTISKDGKEAVITPPLPTDATVDIKVLENWKVDITGLPKFDEHGRAYEYILVEEGQKGDTFHPEYGTVLDKDGNYSTTVTNIEGSGLPVMVTKEWLDDGDTGHRGEVIVEVFKEDGSRLDLNSDGVINEADTIVLNEANGWHQVISCPDGVEPNGLYIVETWVGETEVKGNQDGGTYENNYHKYVVSYLKKPVQVGGVWNYTVANRRVGEVKVSVTKNWVDGEGRLREALGEALTELPNDKKIAPYLRLSFADSVTSGTMDSLDITWSDGSTTKIIHPENGMAVNPYPIDLTNDQSKYIWQAPKYDHLGAVVRYQIEEVWLDKEGNEVIPSEDMNKDDVKDFKDYLIKQLNLNEKDELYTLLSEYGSSVTQQYISYDADTAKAENDSGAGGQSFLQMLFSIPTKIINLFKGETNTHRSIPADDQIVTVVNGLNATKDVFWHKEWRDAYAYDNGIRPDLYLNVYRVVHNSDKKNDTSVERVLDDYRWNYVPDQDTIQGLDDLAHIITHWHIVLKNMPKYDEFGYEIFYYAVEHTKVNMALIDYYTPKYSHVLDVPTAAAAGIDNGEGDAGSSIINMDPIGTQNEPDQDAQCGGQPCVWDLSGVEGETVPYGLLEGGMITNGLQDQVSIEGQKLWESMPTGFPVVDLPGLKFTVSRSTSPDSDDPEDWTEIATTTITKWADLNQNGTFPFVVLYQGHNVVNGKKPDGTWDITVYEDDQDTEQSPQNKPTPLLQYDEDGNRYTYKLTEVEILYQNGESGAVNGEEELRGIFHIIQPDPKTYIARNLYDGVQGWLSIQKYLELQDAGVYPSVRFELTRSYMGVDKDGKHEEKQDDTFSVIKDWKPTKDDKLPGEDDSPIMVAGVITFTDLPIFAPNGEKYLYKIEEIKDGFLHGYDTWVKAGPALPNVNDDQSCEIGNLEATTNLIPMKPSNLDESIAATFLNKVPAEKEFIALSGKKVWQDFGDVFGLRPSTITLDIHRWADQQPGQGNSIPDHIVETITVKGNPKNDIWTFETDAKYEKYAPNGMEWNYKVEEQPNSGNGYYTGSIGTDGTLINSIQTSVSFSKVWTDTKGNPITDDYLGVDLSVAFQLQVKASAEAPTPYATDGWVNAETYFASHELTKKALSGYICKKVLMGRINDENVWQNAENKFAGLPKVVREDKTEDPVIHLEYRVVETQIWCGGYTQNVEVDNDGNYTLNPANGLITGAELNGTTTTNKLSTQALKVVKVWQGDNDNAYATRPRPPILGDYTWEVRFLVQYREAGTDGEWNPVQRYNGEPSQDLIITLNGTDGDTDAEADVKGLPNFGVKDGKLVAYEYRIVELQPISGEVVEDSGAYYNGAYKVAYKHDGTTTTVTNTLETIKPPDPDIEDMGVIAHKIWQPDNRAPAGAEVRFELQYLRADDKWTTLEAVTLNGIAVENPSGLPKVVKEWTVAWLGLPARYKGSKLDNEQSITQYRVVETGVKPENYFLLSSNDFMQFDGESGSYTFNFFNVPRTTLTVEKKWPGSNANEMPEITVGLYRKLGANGAEEAVLDADSKHMTLKLNSTNGWKGTFTGNLPACDEDGVGYAYYAKELDKNGAPIEGPNGDWIVYYGHVLLNDTSFTTTIYNIPIVRVEGIKTWVDNHNNLGDRPEQIEVTLYRVLVGPAANAEKLEGVEPTWTKNGDQWSYVFENLPACTPDGQTYRYFVREAPIEGKDYIGSQTGTDFTNKLSKKIDISGKKFWADSGNNLGDRPEDLELTLYRVPVGPHAVIPQKVDGAVPTWVKEGNFWTYIYSDLDKYDEHGALYIYTVKETVPDGYDEQYDSKLDITNFRRGGLTVSKRVTGNLGETDRAFHFTLTLSGTSSTGIRAESINGTGYDAEGRVEFKDGVAEFTLKHGQSVTFHNLPAGLDYTVEEDDADKNGYTTAIPSGASGTILPGVIETNVEFVNRRHRAPDPTTDVTGTKTWDDEHNAAHLRPNALTVLLYRSVNGSGEELVDAAPSWRKNGDVWSYSFHDLPLRDSHGNRYTYRVEEVMPDGYTGEQSGNNFTNTLDHESVEIPVQKVWVDDNDAAGKRPGSVTVILYADGVEVSRVTLTAGTGWSAVFRELPKRGSDGAEIYYTVREADVPEGYTAHYEGWTIVNTAEPEKPEEPEVPEGPDEPNVPGGPDRPGTPGEPDIGYQTGDPTAPGLWLGLSLASLTLAGILAMGGRRRGKRER